MVYFKSFRLSKNICFLVKFNFFKIIDFSYYFNNFLILNYLFYTNLVYVRFCSFFHKLIFRLKKISAENSADIFCTELFQFKGTGVQLIIDSFFREQFFVVPPLDNAAVIEDHDDVGIHNG